MSFKFDQLFARASKFARTLRPAGATALGHAVKLANDAHAIGRRVHGVWQEYGPAGAVVMKGPTALTVNAVLDRWWEEHALIELKDSTLDSYQAPLARVRTAFGHIEAERLGPAHLERYQDWRALSSAAAAKKEGSLLSSALTFAAERGELPFNPLRGQSSRADFQREQEAHREPTAQEIVAFCELNPHLQGYVMLKQATGLGQTRLLGIDLDQHWDGETLRLPARRRDPEAEIGGDAVAAAIETILDGRSAEGALFLNGRGGRMKTSSFRSSFRRAMAKYVDEGGQRFCEQDIPAGVGRSLSPAEPTDAAAEQTVIEQAEEQPTAADSIAARVRRLNFADSMLMPPSQHDLRPHIQAPGG